MANLGLARLCVDVAQVMLVALDAKGVVTVANRKTCEVLGYPQRRVVGRNWFATFVPGRLRKTVRQTFGKLMAGRMASVEYYENPVLTSRGKERIIAWRNVLLRGNQGRIIGTLSSGTDITDTRRVEEALRHSEALYRTLVETSHDMIFVINRKGIIEYVNEHGAAHFKRRSSELIGTSQQKVFPPAVAARQRKHINRVLRSGKPLSVENQTSFPGGDRWLDTWLVPLENAEGRTVSVMGVSRDITGRKKAEQQLQESEARYHSLFSGVIDAVYVHEIQPGDLPGRLIAVNDGACKMTGYTRKELLTMSIMDIDAPESPVDKASVTRRLVAGRTVLFQQTHVAKNGRRIPVEVHAGTFRMSDRTVVLSVVRDITERTLAHARLATLHGLSQQLLTASNLEDNWAAIPQILAEGLSFDFCTIELIDNAAAETVLVGARGIPLPSSLASPSPLDRSVAGLVVKSGHSILLPDASVRTEANLDDLKKLGAIAILCAPIRCGGEIVAAVTLAAKHPREHADQYLTVLRTAAGAIATDIDRHRAKDAAKRQQEELALADRLASLGTLVSSVAHEINNPTHFIMLNAPIIKSVFAQALPMLDRRLKDEGDFMIGMAPYSKVREKIPGLLDGIETGSHRIRQIVSDLRGFVKQGTARLEPGVDVREVVASAIPLARHTIHTHTDRFITSMDGDVPTVRGQFQRLEQVVINLIQNACQALPDRSRAVELRVEKSPDGAAVVLAVRDEGRGMGPEVLRKVFEPFYTTKADTGGMGLGLAVSKRIVEEHGGTLTLESEPGRGTVAIVTLPSDSQRNKNGDKKGTNHARKARSDN